MMFLHIYSWHAAMSCSQRIEGLMFFFFLFFKSKRSPCCFIRCTREVMRAARVQGGSGEPSFLFPPVSRHGVYFVITSPFRLLLLF